MNPDPFSFERLAAHALAGCLSATAGGGKCAQGAASAVVGKIATNLTGNMDVFTRGVVTSIAGGISSQFAGGKFANGAFTAAYGYLFNQVMENRGRVINSANPSELAEAMQGTDNGSDRGTTVLSVQVNALGTTVSVAVDSYGQAYWSFGRSSFPALPSVSLLYSTVIIDNSAAQQLSPSLQLQTFMEGANISSGFGALGYAGVTKSLPIGYSLDIGVGIGGRYSPRIPVSAGWQVTPKCINCSN